MKYVWGILVCSIILTVQTFEAIFWREDYPFTKWGMYHRLHPFERYINVEIEIDGFKGQESHLLKNPWILRERLWAHLNIGTPTSPVDQSLDIYFKNVQEQSRLHRDEIRSLVLEFLWDPENIKKVNVFFLAWEDLDHTNTRKPDIKYTVFSEKP